MAFAAISRFRAPILDTIPTGKFSHIKTNILMVLHAIHRSAKVRSSHRRYPGTARQ